MLSFAEYFGEGSDQPHAAKERAAWDACYSGMLQAQLATPDDIERARAAYQTDDVVIDDRSPVSRAEDGVWVQAWVRIEA